MSEAVRLLAAELLDVVEGDEELRARVRAIVASEPSVVDGRRFLSVADVVDRSGLSDKTVRRALAAGELPSSKRGGRRLVAADDFETWVRADGNTRPRATATPTRGVRARAGSSFAATLRSRVR